MPVKDQADQHIIDTLEFLSEKVRNRWTEDQDRTEYVRQMAELRASMNTVHIHQK